MCLLSLMLLAVCSLFGQRAAADRDSALEREYQKALAAQDRGDAQMAELILDSLRKRDPGNFAVEETLGMLLASQSRFTEALPVLQAAARTNPSSDVAHTNLGAAYFHLDHFQESAHQFEAAIRLNRRNETAQQSLGQVMLVLKQPARAAEAYDAALALDPHNPDLIEACATARAEAGQLDAARTLLNRLPSLEKSATAQVLLGDIEEKNGNFLEAGNHYLRAAEIDPSEDNVWMVGVEFLRHWTFPAAVEEFERAVVQFPASKRMRLGLGAAYFGDARYPQAVITFAELLKDEPDSALYAGLLGMSCNAVTQQKQPRCADLVTYAEMHPADAQAATSAAASLQVLNPDDDHLQVARKLLENAIAANPNLADAQYQMGVLEQDQVNWTGSIPYLERAIALKPDYAQAHYHLALAYGRTGRKQEGQRQMELQKKFAKQEQEDIDHRLHDIIRFQVDVHH